MSDLLLTPLFERFPWPFACGLEAQPLIKITRTAFVDVCCQFASRHKPMVERQQQQRPHQPCIFSTHDAVCFRKPLTSRSPRRKFLSMRSCRIAGENPNHLFRATSQVKPIPHQDLRRSGSAAHKLCWTITTGSGSIHVASRNVTRTEDSPYES